MSARAVTIGLVIVLAAGAWLRVHRLRAEGLWLDEAVSVAIAQQPLPALVAATAADVHPPLYYIALHYWMRVAGTSELAVRMLSVIFGLAGIVAAYLVAARLFGRSTALVTSAILAGSPFHLYYSQEARMYALLALAATLSMHGFLAMLQPRPSRGAIAGYVAASTAMIYTHAYGMFVLCAQLAYVGAVRIASASEGTPLVRRFCRAQAMLGVAFAPWAVVLAGQLVRVEQGFWIARWPAWLLPYTLVVQAGSWWLAAAIVPLALAAVAMSWRPALTAGGGGAVDLLRRASRDQWRTLLLVSWLAGPVLVPFAMSQVASPIFLPKYTLPSAIALAILAARGLMLIRPRPVRLVAATFLVWAAWTGLAAQYAKVRNDRWREAVATFEQQASPNDLVLFTQPWGQVPFDYYRTRGDVITRPLPPDLAGVPRAALSGLLDAAVEGHARVWFVLSQAGRLAPLLEEELGARFELRSHAAERGVQLYLFERRDSSGAQ